MRRVCIFLLFIGLFQFSYATTYYVSTSGNDGGDGSQGSPWRTLKHAASKVTPNQGHIIKLSSGTFVENGPVDVPVGVSIDGSGIDVTIIKSSSSFYYNPGSPGFGADKYLINFKSNGQVSGNQSIKNLTIDGDGKKLHGGIYVQNRSNFLVENIKVIYTNFSGLWLVGSNNSAIKGLKLLDCAWGSTAWCSGALQIANSTNVDVSQFDISENRGYGIKSLGHTDNTPVSNVKIHDGRVSVNPHGAWNDGKAPNITIEFWANSFPGTEIYNCYIDNTLSLVNATHWGPGIRSTPIKIYNNTFDINGPRAGGYGYSIELSINDAEVYGNFFNGGSTAMVNWHIKQCMGWNIHHNTFYNISRAINSQNKGVSGGGLKDVILANNSIEMNAGVTAFLEVNGSVAENVKIQNNLIISSSTSPKLVSVVAGGSMVNSTISNNFYSGLTNVTVSGATISNNFTGDPKINKTGNRPNPYWLPTAGSPLIDKGVNLGYSFQGAAPDIGAYEYGSSTLPPVNILPSVNLTAPANNANFLTGTSITITANASDTDGLVSKVEFFNGATKLGEDLTSPYSFVWNNAPAGSYSLNAKATDNQAGVTTSNPINITITAANTLPAIAITTPTNNTVVPTGSGITITANASDANGTVSKVEFFSGTVKLGEDLVSPYNFNWNNVPNGAYVITAKATDNQGGVTTSTAVNLTVSNGNNPPVVNLTSPTSNAAFSAGSTVTITANASDTNGSIAKVEFYNGATKLGEDLTSPYSFAWANVPAGSYTLTARATDNAGATTTSNPVGITVNAANTAPVVSLTAPVNNASFAIGSMITLTANAADANGSITKVEFYNGTTKLGEDLTSPYSFIMNNATAGNYSLTAKATDNLGAVNTSTVIRVSVTNSNALPIVTLTSPSNNSYFIPGANITITANASDANGSVTKVEFFQGNTKLGEDLTSPYNFNWAGVPEGTYSLSARATDNQGATTISNLIDIMVSSSTNSPSVSLTSPLNNSTFSSGTSILINADASTVTGSISKVEFFNGSIKLGEDLTSPYSFTWNSVPTGNYTLTAKATDNQAAIITSTAVNIMVNSSTNAPMVNIINPENNSTFKAGSLITIIADASDPNGSVSKVEFYNGNDKLGEDTSSPYTFNWNNVPEGSYVISAIAIDNQGSTQVDEIQIYVGNNPSADAGEDKTLILPASSIQINGSGTSVDGSTLAYSWSQVSGPNNVSISNASLDMVTLDNLIEGSYVIELKVTDSRGLISKDQVTINVVYSDIVADNIPRYFSPNDDGIKDVWEWSNVELYANSTLTVFNRSGQKIYEAVSYQNTWDGSIDGQPLQDGDYYYVIRLSEGDNIKGAVQIIR